MISEKWDEKVIELAKSLINCQSYSGHEDKAAEVLKSYMKETGVFDEIETDCYGNVIGHIKGKNPGSKVLFDGHIAVSYTHLGRSSKLRTADYSL